MSSKMEQALFAHVHENVHGAIQVAVESGSRSIPLERIVGTAAMGMFVEGMAFALAHPAEAARYVAMTDEGAGLDAEDRIAMAEDFKVLADAARTPGRVN